MLGAGTGVRISEDLGITNDRVDWMRRTVTIDRQLVRTQDQSPVFGPVKDFYASVLTRAGESVKVVQERLGHTSA